MRACVQISSSRVKIANVASGSTITTILVLDDANLAPSAGDDAVAAQGLRIAVIASKITTLAANVSAFNLGYTIQAMALDVFAPSSPNATANSTANVTSTYLIGNASAFLPPSATPSPSSSSIPVLGPLAHASSSVVAIGVGIGAALGAVAVAAFVFWHRRRSSRNRIHGCVCCRCAGLAYCVCVCASAVCPRSNVCAWIKCVCVCALPRSNGKLIVVAEAPKSAKEVLGDKPRELELNPLYRGAGIDAASKAVESADSILPYTAKSLVKGGSGRKLMQPTLSRTGNEGPTRPVPAPKRS